MDWYEGWSFSEFNGILIICFSKMSSAIMNEWITREIHPSIHLYIYKLTENDSRRNHDEYVFQIRGDIEQSGEEFFEEVARVSAVPDEHMHEHRVPLRHLLRPFSNEIPISKQLYLSLSLPIFVRGKQASKLECPLPLPVQLVQPIHPIFRNHRRHVRIIADADARNDLAFLVPLHHRVTTGFAANYQRPHPHPLLYFSQIFFSPDN